MSNTEPTMASAAALVTPKRSTASAAARGRPLSNAVRSDLIRTF